MGNNQSQASDDEDHPSYNYHEKVLREARKGMANASECVSDDEQYYSAEEGDSVHSITPPRTRPESSSGEDFSDDSNDDDDGDDDGENEAEDNDTSGLAENQSTTQEAQFLVPESPDGINTSRQASLRSRKSCGQCNVSVAQEHDSIGPELQVARTLGISYVSSANTTQRSEDLSSSRRSTAVSRASAQQTPQINSTTPSPFIPIQAPQSICLNNTSAQMEGSVPSSGKRKISPSSVSPGDDGTPRKKTATRNVSSKRKRLGYFESSESGTDEEDQEKSRGSTKKAKLVSLSPKKSRRLDREARELSDSASESDERRYGKKRRTRRSRRDRDESDSEESIDDHDDRGYWRGRGKHSGKRNKGSSRKGRSKSSDYSSDSYEERSNLGKRRRSGRQRNRRSSVEDDERVASSRKRDRNRNNENNSDENLDEDNDNHQDQSRMKDILSQTKSNNLSDNMAAETDVSSVPCHTFKMGNQSLRNAHGKVLPLRQRQTQESLGVSSLSNIQEDRQSKSDISDLRNIVSNLRPRASAFVASHSIALGKRFAHHAPHPGGDSMNNNVVQAKMLTQNETQNGQQLSDPESFQSAEDEINVSPFHGIVLTPPSGTQSTFQLPQGTKRRANNQNDSEEHISDMEVEDADIAMETQSVQNTHSQSLATRPILQGKRRGRTAAERFRNFWSEKKKNIGTNLRSLFSKTKSPTSQSLNSSNNQSSVSYISSSESLSNSHNSHATERGSGGIFSTSPLAYLSTERRQGSMITSSPQSHPPQRQLRSAGNSAGSISSPFMSGVSPIYSSLSSSQSARIIGQKKTANTDQNSSRHSAVQSKILRRGTPQAPRVTSTGVSPTRVSPRLRSSNARYNQQQSSSQIFPGTDSVEMLPQVSQYQVLNCRLANTIELSISMGDVANQTTASIVNWTDGALTHQVTDCSKSIAARAGALMRAGCNDYIENKGSNLEAPDVLTTPAGGRFDRAVEAILHVVAPDWVDGDEERNTGALLEVYANCLRFADERLGIDSISFPLIGNGVFPTDMCIRSFFDALLIFLAEHTASSMNSDLKSVHLIISDAVSTDFAADFIQSQIDHILSGGLDSVVTDTYSHYFGQNYFEVLQNRVNERSLNSSDSPSEPVTSAERAASGRPRVKRPRF